MGHLSLEAKENIVRKALKREGTTLIAIAKEHNIGYSTIQRWIKEFGSGTLKESSGSKKPINKSEILNHIIATANLDDVSLGEYCRKHGIYSHQLQEWRKDMTKSSDNNNEDKSNIKKLKLENDRLKKELKRKEKALAEASALLVMKKKADLIWGEDEDD